MSKMVELGGILPLLADVIKVGPEVVKYNATMKYKATILAKNAARYFMNKGINELIKKFPISEGYKSKKDWLVHHWELV